VIRLLLRGSALHAAAFVVELVASFILMPFLIHRLGERGYGIWAIIGTIIAQLWILDIGLASTAQRYLANATGRGAETEVSRIYTTAVLMFWMIGAIAFGVVLAILPFAGFWFAPAEAAEFRVALTIAGLNVMLTFPFAVVSGLLNARLRVDLTVSAGIIGTFARVGLIYLFVVDGWGMVGVAAATVLATLLTRAVVTIAKRKVAPEIRFRFSLWDRAGAVDMLGFGKYILLIRLAELLRYRSYSLVIAPILGVEAVARFSVASRMADAFSGLIVRLTTVAGPVFAAYAGRGDIAAIRRAYLLVSELCAALVGIATAGIIVFGERFITLWLGAGFQDSYRTLVPLIIGMMALGLQAPSRDVLGALYKHPFDAKTNVIEAMASVALTLVLLPALGLPGAGVAAAAAMMVNKGVILPIYVCRQLDLPRGRYYLTLARPLAVSLAMGCVAYAVLPLDNVESLFTLCLIGAGFGLVTTAIAAAFLTADCRARVVAGLRGGGVNFS
jgi:O-antigen/teichoic acid export membrane protein